MRGQVLVLAHAADKGASSVAARLARRVGPGRVRVVRPELLGLARWSHRVSGRGRASTRLVFPGSEPLVSADVAAVLNRVQYLSVPRFRLASAKDRDYAAAELHAVVASWLAELGDRAIHDVRCRPWVIACLSRQEWASAAAACNLPLAQRTVDSSTDGQSSDPPESWTVHGSVLVAGGAAGGALAEEYGERCIAAARALGMSLLEFHFAGTSGATVLVRVDPLPPLLDPWATRMVSELLTTLARGASP